jgi:hypothetical protein
MNAVLPKRLRIPEQVLAEELEGESVLLNLQTERYYGLNDIGTRVWQLLHETESSDTLVRTLMDEYEVEEATLRADLAGLFDKMAAAGLVEIE